MFRSNVSSKFLYFVGKLFDEWGTCLYSKVRKKSQNWLAFSTDENSETLESSAIKDGRSMLATFLAVLYEVEGLETETLK